MEMTIFKIVKEVSFQRIFDVFEIKYVQSNSLLVATVNSEKVKVDVRANRYSTANKLFGDTTDFVAWYKGIRAKEAAELLYRDFVLKEEMPYFGSVDDVEF